MTRGLLRLLGSVLIAYGLIGAVLLGAVGATVARPLDDIGSLGSSLDDQQAAALEALDQASVTIVDTAAAVRNMDTSLAQANLATLRAAGISRGMAQTMRNLAFEMQLTIFGVQPLIGLASGFDQSGEQLDLLANDVQAIGTALDANRTDTVAIAGGLDELARSIDGLRVAVAASPNVTGVTGSLGQLQLALLALIGWLLVAAVGSILAGVGCWLAARRARHGSIEPTA
ncbi:hypothetical protein BH23CHL7_BH23CHL7_00710 [soil metagenome]